MNIGGNSHFGNYFLANMWLKLLIIFIWSEPSPKLKDLTKEGLRVIAIASKEILEPIESVLELERINVESDLSFLGFLILKNELKDESKIVLEELHQADIKTLMVTGDNLLTAISVSKRCGLFEDEKRVIMPKIMKNGLSWEDENEKEVFDIFKKENKFIIAMTGNVLNMDQKTCLKKYKLFNLSFLVKLTFEKINRSETVIPDIDQSTSIIFA